ncbi:SymE family type I addiction module toxin [Salmonirosea aquatica]|uniref:Type I addiction module toxin, SymE family n=1 Tax=Salmonirosea aquatica TaxID=2654236 RepID=A0A7C9FAT9_9BACT|nr:type I addiction module toxin, SymE family [Cytophagaceae bacterium SJW1-29]
MNSSNVNQTRPRKIGYQARPNWRTCRTRFFPSLLLAGNWFAEAGFDVGQSVTVEVQSGIITIRPATS